MLSLRRAGARARWSCHETLAPSGPREHRGAGGALFLLWHSVSGVHQELRLCDGHLHSHHRQRRPMRTGAPRSGLRLCRRLSVFGMRRGRLLVLGSRRGLRERFAVLLRAVPRVEPGPGWILSDGLRLRGACLRCRWWMRRGSSLRGHRPPWVILLCVSLDSWSSVRQRARLRVGELRPQRLPIAPRRTRPGAPLSHWLTNHSTTRKVSTWQTASLSVHW